jgi:hypothetical protein
LKRNLQKDSLLFRAATCAQQAGQVDFCGSNQPWEVRMYPMIYFQSFRQLVLGDEVFVAMPMSDPAFDPIWTEVYRKAIESVGLVAFRANIPQTGDSILIEILSGLRRAKFVLADISPDHNSGEHPNANVMYELGIAHTIWHCTHNKVAGNRCCCPQERRKDSV